GFFARRFLLFAGGFQLLAFDFRLFFRLGLWLDPAHGDAGAHDQGLGVVGREVEAPKAPGPAHSLARLGFEPAAGVGGHPAGPVGWWRSRRGGEIGRVTPWMSSRPSSTPSSRRLASYSAASFSRKSRARAWISSAVSSSKPSIWAISPAST